MDDDELDDSLTTEPTELPSYLVFPLVVCWLFLLRGLLSIHWKHQARFATIVRACLWAAIFASGLTRIYAVNSKSKVGAVKHIIASTASTFTTLSGVIVCAFQRDRRVSILIVLNCVLIGYLYYVINLNGFKLEALTGDYVVFKTFSMLFGLISARVFCVLAGWCSRGRLLTSLIPLGLAAILDVSLGCKDNEYGYFVFCAFSYIASLPLALFAGVSGHYYCLIASIISASCFYPFNKIIVAYAASAGQLYLWFFGPKQQRFKRLWIAVSVTVLLGLNLLATVGSTVKEILPLILQSMFFGSGLLACKVLTPKLGISERTRVLLASLGTFPIVTLMSLGLKPTSFVMHFSGSVGSGGGFFDTFAQLHFIPLASSMFSNWRGRWFTLLLTSVFLFGLSSGHEMFIDGVFSFASTLRLAAILAAATFGVWRLDWESRFYALLACVLVCELFRAPLSAMWLMLVYGVAHRYLSGHPVKLANVILDE